MANFMKVFSLQGYDRHRPTHWQMVPMLFFRYVALRDGAALTVTSTRPGTCAVTEIRQADIPRGAARNAVTGFSGGTRRSLRPTDRVFLLQGFLKGSAIIRASGGPGAVDLEVDVKPIKTVRVTFNFVRDSAGHRTRRVPAQTARWLTVMNRIYRGQANIRIESRLNRPVTVAKDLGRVITTTQSGVGEEADLYTHNDPGADVNMYFVWNMNITDQSGDEDAFADGPRVVFEDRAGRQPAETMAHEIGHTLGVGDHYTASRRRELMYGYTDDRGWHLPKDHVNTMNP